MKISDEMKQRVIASTMTFVKDNGRSSHLASQVIQNMVRADADDDEDGHWVTTENKHKLFINGEGEPTKGNPHVLAAARGEKGPKKNKTSGGSGPDSPEHTAKKAPQSGAGAAPSLAKPNKYRETAEKMKKEAEKKPNNLHYAEMVQNYTALADAADKFDPEASEHKGMQTVMALQNAKIGDTVEIKGNIFEGTYKLENVKSPWNNKSGPAWVAQDEKNHKHAFANNPATIMSEMRLIDGGKAVDDQTRSVSKAGAKNASQSSAEKPVVTAKEAKPAARKYSKEDDEKATEDFKKLRESKDVDAQAKMLDDMPAGTVIHDYYGAIVKGEDGTWKAGTSIEKIGSKKMSSKDALKNVHDHGWPEVQYPKTRERDPEYDKEEYSTKALKKKPLKSVTADDCKAVAQRIADRHEQFRKEYQKARDVYDEEIERNIKPGMSEYERYTIRKAAAEKSRMNHVISEYKNANEEDMKLVTKWGNSSGKIPRDGYKAIEDLYFYGLDTIEHDRIE